jgi:hypothetical protein
MGWGINLRRDLARLSDGELAAEFDRLSAYHAARFGSVAPIGSLRGWWRTGFIWPLGRGPLHARWAYRFWISYYWVLRGPVGTQYLVECELKDLLEEVRRRVKRRNTKRDGVK